MQENILISIQSISTNFLDILFQAVTRLGEEYFYIIILTFVFWNISKKYGFILCYTYLFSMWFNEIFKLIFHTKRPFEVSNRLKSLRIKTATGYSFPSGHTQGTATFFTTLSLILKKWWFVLISSLIIISVAFSRLYLGVHWPIDVVGGIFFGIFFSFLFYFILINIYDKKDKLFIFLIITSFIVIIIFIIILIINKFVINDKLNIINLPKISGIFLGITSGFMLEEKFVGFKNEHSNKLIIIIRYILGLLSTIIIMFLLKFVLPDFILLNFLRYLLVGLWIVFLYPLIALKIKLFEKEKIK